MRVAIVYDCLYPYTIGGAERWYRDLAEHLAERHEVTYLTRRQWSGESPASPPRGVRVVAIAGGGPLYSAAGRRRILPPIRFGAAVLFHLLRARSRYDVVHTCAFPYFSHLAATLARSLGGPPVVSDWIEVWPRSYWREYLGPVAAVLAERIQRLCIRTTDRAFVLSRLAAERLRAHGYHGEPIQLSGLTTTARDGAEEREPRKPTVVFAGRHIAEKRVRLLPAVVARARERIPSLEAVVFGDGPERAAVLAEISRLGLSGAIRCPGFVPWDEVDRELRRALCLILPSRREGYALSVVEAAARGTPSIVTDDAESAAVESVEDGLNGLVAADARVDTLAAAIVAIHAEQTGFRERTRAWYARNRERLSIEGSVATIERVYREVAREVAREVDGPPAR